MPGVRAFGRKWQLASDDLVIPAAIGVLFHTTWLLLTLVNFFVVTPSAKCEPQKLLYTYLGLNATIASLMVVLESLIGWTSLRGTVSDDRPRQSLKYWIPAHAFFVGLDMVTQLLGLILVSGPNPLTCSQSKMAAILTYISVTIGILFLIVWLIIITYLYIRSSPLDSTAIDTHKLWQWRMEMLCFGHRASKDRRRDAGHSGDRSAIDGNEILKDVARIFADFLDDAETVASDVMVGLIYVRRRQHLTRMYEKRERQWANKQKTIAHQPVRNDTGSSSSSSAVTEPHTISSADEVESFSSSTPLTPQKTQNEFAYSTRRSSTPTPVPAAIKTSIEMSRMSGSGSGSGDKTNSPTVSKEAFLNLGQPVSSTDLEEVAYYIQYAEAIYGLPLYMLGNFTRGLQHLLCPSASLLSCCRPPAAQSVIESVTTHLGSPGWPFCCISERAPRDRHSDLVALSLDNGIFRSPYMIALDHDMGAVVVAVRGTLSTADVLVDLNCDLATVQIPARFHPSSPKNMHPEDGEVGNDAAMGGEMMPIKTHAGMLMTAGNIRDEILGVLEELVKNPEGQYYGYKLIVCGHSLGAGVASLLTHLLRLQSLPAYCYAYSPPGCITTPSGIPYFSTFCTSVVLGDDIVPRLNRSTVEKLKREIKESVSRCQRRKIDILGGFVLGECLGIGNEKRDDEWWKETEELDSHSYQHDQHTHARPNMNEADLEVGELHSSTSPSSPLRDRMSMDLGLEPMRLPGRVLYFRKERIPESQASNGGRIVDHSPDDENLSDEEDEDTEEPQAAAESMWMRFGSRTPQSSPPRGNTFRRRATSMRKAKEKKKTVYVPVWAHPDEFDEITISATMGPDHMPNALGVVLRQAKEAGVEEPWVTYCFRADGNQNERTAVAVHRIVLLLRSLKSDQRGSSPTGPPSRTTKKDHPQQSREMIAIRQATPADVPKIHHFIRQLAIYEKLEDQHVGTEADLHKTLFGPRQYAEVAIASLDGVDVGMALYFFNYSTFLAKPGLYLEDLFVAQDSRGKGVGKALLKHLAGIAVERDCGRMEWTALDWNTPAINFYKSIGAKTMDEWLIFRLTGDGLKDFAVTGGKK
ncbi:hypothetical protein HDV05_004804 [Chytridiales sp. JEL 0842]|nr:hypothetical protein HDV05_004804 [Chytridiales sp. JEL 0842]